MRKMEIVEKMDLREALFLLKLLQDRINYLLDSPCDDETDMMALTSFKRWEEVDTILDEMIHNTLAPYAIYTLWSEWCDEEVKADG